LEPATIELTVLPRPLPTGHRRRGACEREGVSGDGIVGIELEATSGDRHGECDGSSGTAEDGGVVVRVVPDGEIPESGFWRSWRLV